MRNAKYVDNFSLAQTGNDCMIFFGILFMIQCFLLKHASLDTTCVYDSPQQETPSPRAFGASVEMRFFPQERLLALLHVVPFDDRFFPWTFLLFVVVCCRDDRTRRASGGGGVRHLPLSQIRTPIPPDPFLCMRSPCQ